MALAVGEDGLYAGGTFETAGNVGAMNVARWDGAAWFPVGAGFDNSVRALAFHDSLLYAGGDFSNSGALPVNHVAEWNGAAWSSLAGGMGGDSPSVLAFASYAGDLVAGGWFIEAGGVSAPYIARWNGSAWAALPNGPDFWVECLAVYQDELIAGGQFTFIGQNPASYLARWDGEVWESFGSGMDSWVKALRPFGEDLFAGGLFTRAGRTASLHLARWYAENSPVADEEPESARSEIRLVTASALPACGPVRLGYFLPAPAAMALEIFDAQGRPVRRLIEQPAASGWHAVSWDGTGEDGRRAPSGVYFARLSQGAQAQVRRLVLAR